MFKGPFTHTLRWAALRCVALVLVTAQRSPAQRMCERGA